MSRAIISLGSNMGDRKEMLRQALMRISFSNTILGVSDVYETYMKEQGRRDPFLNICVEIETDMNNGQLLQFLLETQRQLSGETVDDTYSQRAIDCDLISFEDQV